MASRGRFRSKSEPIGERHWSLALETFRLARGERILESPDDFRSEASDSRATKVGQDRPLRVLFTRDPIPQISLLDLLKKAATGRAFRGQDGFHRSNVYRRHL